MSNRPNSVRDVLHAYINGDTAYSSADENAEVAMYILGLEFRLKAAEEGRVAALEAQVEAESRLAEFRALKPVPSADDEIPF